MLIMGLQVLEAHDNTSLLPNFAIGIVCNFIHYLHEIKPEPDFWYHMSLKLVGWIYYSCLIRKCHHYYNSCIKFQDTKGLQKMEKYNIFPKNVSDVIAYILVILAGNFPACWWLTNIAPVRTGSSFVSNITLRSHVYCHWAVCVKCSICWLQIEHLVAMEPFATWRTCCTRHGLGERNQACADLI